MVAHRRMDRKLKTLLKGAGLERLVGGARRDTAYDPAEEAAWRASLTPEQLAEMEKDETARRIRTEEANKQNAINRTKQKEEQTKQELLKREKQLEEDKKLGIEMLMPTEADYQEWFKANYPNTDPSKAGSLGDTNIFQNENFYAQQYLEDLGEEDADPAKMIRRAKNEIEVAKKKIVELKANPPKPSIKDFVAFGLPRTATFDQLVAAVSAARAKGELSQNQKNYGSSIVDNYLKIKETAEADPQQYAIKKINDRAAYVKQQKANLGLQPDADSGDIALARANKAKQSNIDSAKQKTQEDLYQQWQGIERSENFRIREALVNVRNEIQSQMKDKDKIDRLPYRVMFQELLNNEISRKQIYELQGLAYRHGLETPEEFVNAVNSGKLVVYKDVDYRRGRNAEPEPMPKIVLFDAAKATEEYKQQLENEITWQEKAGHYLIMGSILLTDIAAELLPYAMPLLGTALSLGWKAFAPEGSLNYQEGTIGQKFGRLGLSIVEDGVKRAIGFGRTRASRRKAMTKMMDDEVKLHGGSRYSLTPEGSKQYNAWSNNNISKEVITLTELNKLKTILTEGSNIPPDTIQNIVLEFGIEWNKGIQKLMNLLDEDEKGKTGVKIGIPPQPVRKRPSGMGKALVKKQ